MAVNPGDSEVMAISGMLEIITLFNFVGESWEVMLVSTGHTPHCSTLTSGSNCEKPIKIVSFSHVLCIIIKIF